MQPTLENTFFQTTITDWIATLALNTWIIQKQVDGLSHDDTMLKLPFRGNRLNWVLGHIIEHRDWMLKALDAEPLLFDNTADIYRRGSAEINAETPVLTLETLIELLQTGQTKIAESVTSATPEFLMEVTGRNYLMESHRDKSRLQRLQGLLWHETYHTGQTELFRQLAGKNDAVLS
ncbi:MAG: hypothetical protein ACPG7F_09080 [Aggregatilineales bacterium]